MRSKIISCFIVMTLVAGSAVAAENALVDAVKQKNSSAVKALLQKRVDVNAREGDGATALHWAAYRDDLEMVNLLINAGAKVNVANDLRITPLALAAANGNGAIVERLLKAGAEPDAASEAGVTPLMQAARTGNVEAVKSLVEHEANVNAKENDRQQTALMWAASQGHPGVVKILLEHGADFKARTRVRNLTIVDSSAPRIKASKDGAKQIDSGSSTALIFAALSGDPESARLLIAAGADANDAQADGNSALVLAAFNDNGPVASVLLDAGANPNTGSAGYTALHASALRGDLQTVKKLLAKGADPNALITKGSPVRRFGSQWALPGAMIGGTPLLVATAYLEVEIVRALTAAGANPTLGVQSGVTPLLVAAGSQLEREARPSDLIKFSVPDADSPVIPRPEPDVLEVTRILLDAGSDVNQVNAAGDTALHSVTSAGMTTVIQLLSDRGAKLDIKNRQGQTPLALTTTPRGGRGGQGANPENAAKLKAAEELLRKLGATP